MRINNKRIAPYIINLHALLLLALVIAITLTFIPIGVVVRHISPYYLTFGVILILILLYRLGHQHFEYDSDGEVINIKTQNSFWSRYFPKQKRIVDFPKSKLDSFKIINSFPKKTLEMYIKSKRASNGVMKLKFNITFLNKKEINSLKISLNRIVKANQEKRIRTLK